MRATFPRLTLALVLLGAVSGAVLWTSRESGKRPESIAASPRPVPVSVPADTALGTHEPSRPVQPARPLPVDAVQARENQLQETARTWARSDLPAAAAWLLTLSAADAAIASDAVLAEVGRDDAAGAIALALALRRGVDDGRVEHVAQIWTEEDPAAAVAWISSLPAGPARDRLLARAALVRVPHDPAESARLLATMTDGLARDAALAATIARLRLYEPTRADTWAALLAK